MRLRVLVPVSVLVSLALTSCDLLPNAAPPPSTTTITVTPTLTPRRPPPPGYIIDHCGVSGTINSGQPSNVLLTIDDYPSEEGRSGGELMIRIADWARDAGVMMEAFPIKSKVDAYLDATGVDLVAELRARGTYVSNHSYTHPELPVLDPTDVLAEIQKGVRSTYLRPPYGTFTPTIQQIIEQEGYRVCLWNVDTNDWRKLDGKYPSPKELVRRVHTKLMEIPVGSPVVILGHYYTNYPEALPAIIEEVEAMGNRVCPAPSLPVTEEVPYPIC